MLSDEENNVIDLLKNIDKQKCLMLNCPVVKNNIERQLKIIELNRIIRKQSKEIEELKENNKKLTDEYLIQRDLINPDFLKDYISKEEAEQKEKKAYIDGTNVAHELCNKYWEDKIKAIIEELNNKLKNADEIEAVFIIKQQQVLQSLLEKE